MYAMCILGDKKAATLDTAPPPLQIWKVPYAYAPSSLLLHAQLLFCFFICLIYNWNRG